ncbi:hypothetical protein [Candidatus Scalindua japonica]|uniref:hypothetical protein n=1 Tax=Candidatus Scalindua japonica TaxID=1284222 RepID=UPI0010541419|nr:hypothetical protein [Candidatus Scalindua japonica]
MQDIRYGTTSINSRCGTSRYRHIVKTMQNMAKQIGVPSQNRHLFLRNKFILIECSKELFVITWQLRIMCVYEALSFNRL